MISGILKKGRATVNIIFRLPNKPDFTIEFVIDTGFTEFLSLPPAAVTLLGFPFVYDMYENLADNSNVILPVHQANIIWNGEEREVNVLDIILIQNSGVSGSWLRRFALNFRIFPDEVGVLDLHWCFLVKIA